MPEIAKTLNVTVDELLNGEKAPIVEIQKADKQKDEKVIKENDKKFFEDPKLWFIISFFFGIFGALLGTITELYCIRSFRILFYTHWEIMFVAVALFAVVASGLAFMIGVFRTIPAFEKKTFLEYCKKNIQQVLIYCAVWVVFPLSFLTRIFEISRFGNFTMVFVSVVVAIYVILNVKIYKKYKKYE